LSYGAALYGHYNATEKQATSQKRKRGSENPDIEKAFNHWLSITTGRCVRASEPMMKNKSEELGKTLSHIISKQQ
jgi:hypothetical protein